MKKLMFLALLGLVFSPLTSPGKAAAQENAFRTGAPTTTPPDRRAPEATERLEQRQENAAERLVRLRALWQERIGKFLDLTNRRLTAAHSRLTGVADRIESRLEKFAAGGADVAAARESLSAARTAITEAADALQTFQNGKADLAATVAAELENRGVEPMRPLREAIQEVEESLRVAHRALVEVVVELKGLSTQ